MQKKLFIAIFFLFLPIFAQAETGYEISEAGVAFDGQPVEFANAESFEAVSADNGKDRNFCFYKNQKINNCQPKNFDPLLGDYAKDQFAAFWQGSRIEGAEAGTFSALDAKYAKDRSRVYFEGQVVPGASSDLFNVLTDGYARDRSNLYKGSALITGVDPASFEIINQEYYKDKDNVYFQGEIVENAHPGSFRMMANEYARDANYFYRYGKAVAKSANKYYERFKIYDLADTCVANSSSTDSAADIVAVDHGFAKDGQCVYYQMETLEHSHAQTFEIINEKIAKDKNFVYIVTAEGVRTLSFASASTFVSLGGGYFKDRYVVYYGHDPEIINGADVDTFKMVCTGENCTYEAEDKNRYYLGGLEVGLDDKTRQIIGEAKLINSSPDDIEALVRYNAQVRDLAKEREINEKYIKNMIIGVHDLEARAKVSLINFILYGTQTTRILGAGERAGVVGSYKSAFGRLPQTEQDWTDIIKIANGRWPTERNEIAEERADRRFRYIYHRAPFSFDQHDQAAITVIAYGLRTPVRNMESEKSAILTFRKMFIDYPASASDWDMVRAIAYSGATR